MIYTIVQLDTTENGPEALNENNNFQKVFLNQGTLDCACGPYSIFMALLTLGVIERDEATSFNIDGRTKVGKLINELNNNHFSLFKKGTYLKDLENILSYNFNKSLNIKSLKKSGREIIDFTIEQLKNDCPTIVGLRFKNGAHWMLAVGYEEHENKIIRLLFLDSSGEQPNFCSWNSIVDINKPKKGIYPYKWWTYSEFIQFEEAISIEKY
jgi:hypothetical protein